MVTVTADRAFSPLSSLSRRLSARGQLDLAIVAALTGLRSFPDRPDSLPAI